MSYSVEGLINSLGIIYYIIVYGIGVIAMALSVIAFQFKHRVTIILSNFFGQTCWVAYFLLQGDVTSAIACALSAVMLAVFSKKDKWKWATHPVVIIFFIVLLCGFSLLSFKNWTDIFPILAGVFAVIANSRATEKHLRQFSVLWCLSWLLNSAFKMYPVAFINDFLCTASTIISLIRYRDTSKNKKNYSILFIGNSYTYYNDMPVAIFKEFAETAGYTLDVTAITKGAHKLSQFADPTDDYGSRVEAELTGDKKYDYVILQEQSIRPISKDANDFYDAVKDLVARIRKTGATPILYSTWGRNDGSETLDEYGWSNESMTRKLAASYQAIADELEIDVAHVGVAFYDVHTNQSTIDLYDPDKSHPSYEGSYLAAATLFAKVFEQNPTEVSYDGNLSSDDAKTLRTAAQKAVFESVPIPEEYKINL